MNPVEFTTFPLSKRNGLCLIATFSIVAHVAFNRLEPREPTAILTLLIILPGVLSTILLPHFSHWITAMATAFSTYYMVLSISLVVYRLSPFHPLARYPGHTLDKISMLWVAFVGIQGKRYLHVQSLHQKYGDVVRIGPNELSIRDPSVIAPLLGTQGLPKGPQQDGLNRKSAIPNLVGIRDRKLHMERRTRWLRGLNAAALKDYEPIIRKRVTQLVEKLEGSAGETVDLSKILRYFAYDFIRDMAFGGGTEILRDGDVHNHLELLETVTYSAVFFGRIPWASSFFHLLEIFAGGIFATGFIEFNKFGEQMVRNRKEVGSQTKDLFHHLLDEGGHDEEPPSLEQVLSDGTLAIGAGSETTATTLSNLFFLLMSHPQAYARLQAEVDKFYPADEDSLNVKYHGDMPYLNACINETLRVLPLVPGGSQRACYKGMGGMMIGTYYIPEETAVSTNFYAIQRDPRNFSPNTDAFWPERWLIAEKKDLVAIPPSPSYLTSPPVVLTRPRDFVHNMDAFVPFSYGPANCVGKFLALQEMKTVVCHMMQKLDMRFVDGYDTRKWFEDLKEQGIFKNGILPVVVARRE